METPENTNGIPMTPTDIPQGSILSPIQIEDLGDDNDQDFGGFDTDGGVGVRVPRDPDDFGGDEAEEDYDDEDDDDSDTGFGIGLLLSTVFTSRPPLLPA